MTTWITESHVYTSSGIGGRVDTRGLVIRTAMTDDDGNGTLLRC